MCNCYYRPIPFHWGDIALEVLMLMSVEEKESEMG